MSTATFAVQINFRNFEGIYIELHVASSPWLQGIYDEASQYWEPKKRPRVHTCSYRR
jgi:hypothetical protein